MEVGSCFRNYYDFKECFNTYKKENKCHYGLKNCVSVRFYNRKHGTSIREDITFIQVKFGCVRTREYSKKRKQQPSLCPAFFILQYNEEIDRLVITDLNSNHIHVDPGGASLARTSSSQVTRATTKTAGCLADGSPRTKLRRQQSRETEATVTLSEECAMADVTLNGASAPLTKAAVLPEPVKESASTSALVRIAEVMKNFLRVDMGSLASISVGSNQDLDRLNFQTSKMRSLFVKFPESLLLHRVQSERGHVLYAFLVESKERVGKMVHFAVLKEDTGENVSKMLTVFREFNPEWQKVKVVFVDMSFRHKATMQELFPTTQVLLSVYHTVRFLEKKVKETEASVSFKHKLKLALKEVVFSTSTANLDILSQLVKRLDKELYDYLQTNWFSCEMLWYMHAKKGLHSCSTYVDSLDLITHKISSLFNKQLSLETSIVHFVEYADCFNTKGLENLNQGISVVEEENRSKRMEKSKVRTRASLKRTPDAASPPQNKCSEPPSQIAKQNPAKTPGTMLAAIRESCTDLSYQLCLNEWEVVQRSTQLINVMKDNIVVQLLEDTHQVSKDCKSCSCYFHCRYQLPCRHILSVLHANKKAVEEAMVCKRWQKKYQHLSVLGENLLEDIRPSVGNLPAAAEERYDKIQSLSKELANLLMQCDGEELEERSSTLKMIVDIWAKSSEPVEDSGKCATFRNVGDLPFLWVKQEEMEMEDAERSLAGTNMVQI
ncbi:zinc finger SWIM domain-containing protein 3 [Pelodiscus sinensis]|uniref:Zinc finger SWIM-type containing 3 n=1 Tax=Pelodiscus sinensis TaxID=13735 RepID=K7FQ26_PELSI|nr:zinc finger SWIM domain-containing protein 3 [Pelodiscus sinensis]|eukprot:XP_025042474.1 zinc finger SWIM domain-containing protein 3 [Pelodiscus sinensis]